MNLEHAFTSETGLTFVTTILGGLWTFFKSSEWFAGIRERRYGKAVEALEAGVEQTYRMYVRAIKESRQDGQLTDAERAHARELARQTAIDFGRTQGIDILRELGGNYMDLWIAKLVNAMKP